MRTRRAAGTAMQARAGTEGGTEQVEGASARRQRCRLGYPAQHHAAGQRLVPRPVSELAGARGSRALSGHGLGSGHRLRGRRADHGPRQLRPPLAHATACPATAAGTPLCAGGKSRVSSAESAGLPQLAGAETTSYQRYDHSVTLPRAARGLLRAHGPDRGRGPVLSPRRHGRHRRIHPSQRRDRQPVWPAFARRSARAEVVYLATCNRVEVVFAMPEGEGARDMRAEIFQALTGRPPKNQRSPLHAARVDGRSRRRAPVPHRLRARFRAGRRARNRRAAPRRAWDAARDAGVCGPVLDRILGEALEPFGPPAAARRGFAPALARRSGRRSHAPARGGRRRAPSRSSACRR